MSIRDNEMGAPLDEIAGGSSTRLRDPDAGRGRGLSSHPIAGIAALTLFALICSARAAAHDFKILVVSATFAADGAYQVDVSCDLDALLFAVAPGKVDPAQISAFLDLPMEEVSSRLRELERTLSRYVRLRFDGEQVEPQITYPQFSLGRPRDVDGHTTLIGYLARFSGKAPDGAGSFTFWASRAMGPVSLTLRREGSSRPTIQALQPADESNPFPLVGEVEPPSRLDVALQYLILGFTHIIPKGLDHILFVLGLFLLSPKLGPLLWQVSAFTLAHTLTLGLSIYGVISLPSFVVEPLIALSIAFVAIENLFTTELKPWRPAVVFAFGLLHGMGFAGVLTDLGLPRSEFVTALLSFNIGVEAGQAGVIGLALLCVGWFRRESWYRRRIVIPLSVAIAMMGLFWAGQRALGL